MNNKPISNKKFIEEWNNIFEFLPDEKLIEIRSFLVSKSYIQAEEVSGYGEICPGLIKVKTGKIRCIYQNKNSLNMLSSYKEGDIFGAEHILSDIKEQTLVTSTSAEL